MGSEIVIEVGDSYAGKHEQFSELLGEQFNARMRSLVEDELHTVTQQIERQSEQEQTHINHDPVEELEDE